MLLIDAKILRSCVLVCFALGLSSVPFTAVTVRAQELPVRQVEAEAMEAMQAVITHLFRQESLVVGAARPHLRPSPATLLRSTGGVVAVWVDWWAGSEALYPEGVERPDRAHLAEALADMAKAEGVDAVADSLTVSRYCPWVSLEPRRSTHLCSLPPGVGMILRIGYPSPRAYEVGDMDWLIIPVHAYTEHEGPDGLQQHQHLAVRLEPTDDAWEVVAIGVYSHFSPRR